MIFLFACYSGEKMKTNGKSYSKLFFSLYMSKNASAIQIVKLEIGLASLESWRF